MKRIVLALLVSLMFVAPAVIFYTAQGQIKMNNLTLKSGGATVTVRPAGVVIKP